MKKISQSQEMLKELKKEGKVGYFDKPEHLKAIKEMNEEMEGVRRDYQQKNMNSQISAAHVILNS